MSEFLTWDSVLTFTGVILAVGILTQMLKHFSFSQKLHPQIISYIIAFVLLTVGQLVTYTFTWAHLALNLVNAAAVSLATNGGYDAVTALVSKKEG